MGNDGFPGATYGSIPLDPISRQSSSERLIDTDGSSERLTDPEGSSERHIDHESPNERLIDSESTSEGSIDPESPRGLENLSEEWLGGSTEGLGNSTERLIDPDIPVGGDPLPSGFNVDTRKVYVPNDDEEFIDPRLSKYPIPFVAKTVDLHNDDS
jgi:hypothetical protein